MIKKREHPYSPPKATHRLMEQTKWTARLREVTEFWLFSDLSQFNGSGLFRWLTNLSLQGRISWFRSGSNDKAAVSSRLKPLMSASWPRMATLTTPNTEFFKFKKRSLFLNRLSGLFLLNAGFEVGSFFKGWWPRWTLIFATIIPIVLIVLWQSGPALTLATDVFLLHWRCGFLQYFDYFYFLAGVLTKTLQLSDILAAAVAAPPFANFHIKTITSAFLFQDFELIVSYSEPFWLFFYSDPLTLAGYPLVLLFILFFVIALLALLGKVLNVTAFLRSDVWRFFISISHDSSWLGRLHSAEALNQVLGGRLMSLISNSGHTFGGLQNFYVLNQKTGVVDADRAYFEYFFAKTVGGAVGFADLFPSTSARRNAGFGWRGKLKTFLFFRKIRGLLLTKTHLMGRAFTAQAILRWWQPSVKKLGKARTLQAISGFLSPQIYLDFTSLGFWRRFLDGCFNISRGGDVSTLKLRHYFFKAAVEDRDPWNLFDRANRKGGKRGRLAINPQRVNWYGRELNAFVMSKILRTRFTIPALRKFRIKSHSQVNDYSFWKPELNLVGRNAYSSKWDAFKTENLFDVNELRASRFAAFEALESEEEDDSHLDYVDEDLEVFFDDNLLHKDFELLFFNHEFDDIVVSGRSDGLIEDLSAMPKLKAILTNESLVYGAGQEADYVTKTHPTAYAGLHAAEYMLEGEYRRELADSVYNDLSDYLALNALSVAPRVFSIPEGRSFFYWDNTAAIEGSEISERARLGRFLYFYWRAASKFFAANYYKLWLPTYISFFASTFVWFLVLLWLVTAWIITTQLGSYLLVGKFLGGVLFLVTLTPWIFIFFAAWKSFLAERSKRYAILSFMLLESAVWLSLVAISFFLRKVKLSKVSLPGGFILKRALLCFSPFNANRGNPLVASYSDRLLGQFLVRYVPVNSPVRVAGVNEFALIQKLTGHTQFAGLGFSFPYNPPVFNTIFLQPTANLGLRVRCTPVTHASTAFTVYRECNGGDLVAARVDILTPRVILYDFDWRNATNLNVPAAANFVRANFASDMLFQASIRQLRQHRALWHAVAAASSLATSPTRLPLVENALRARLGVSVVAPHFISDLLFDALGNDVICGSRLDKRQELALSATSHPAVGGVRSKRTEVGDFSSRFARSRLHSTRFLEDGDLLKTRNYTNQNARENFLRLFLSKGLLREIYGERTKAISGTPHAKWSYTSQIKWTIYATPLHDVKRGI